MSVMKLASFVALNLLLVSCTSNIKPQAESVSSKNDSLLQVIDSLEHVVSDAPSSSAVEIKTASTLPDTAFEERLLNAVKSPRFLVGAISYETVSQIKHPSKDIGLPVYDGQGNKLLDGSTLPAYTEDIRNPMVYISRVVETELVNDDEKYRLLDRLEAELKNSYSMSSYQGVRIDIGKREVFVCYSYAEASRKIQELKGQ
jgi:hypothetical protein